MRNGCKCNVGLVIVLSLWMLGGTSTVRACTAFALEGVHNILMGSNLDWEWENGLVIINQRNIAKASLAEPGASSVHWVSKYGSVTFNQFGQEMPFGGMNEAGLAIACSWLESTEYPTSDTRPAINLLQWIQYQLDNSRTIKEVLATDRKLRVYAPQDCAFIHYLLCDAQGNSTVIEFLHGKMVCYQGSNLVLRALANNEYRFSVDYALNERNVQECWDRSSLSRFSYAAQRAAHFNPCSTTQNVTYAFDTLRAVSQGNLTAWSIVYDISNRKIYFRTHSNSRERIIDVKDMNFSCGGPVQFADIEANPNDTGALDFKDLSIDLLTKYLKAFVDERSVRQRFGDLTPEIQAQLLMLENFRCVGDK